MSVFPLKQTGGTKFFASLSRIVVTTNLLIACWAMCWIALFEFLHFLSLSFLAVASFLAVPAWLKSRLTPDYLPRDTYSYLDVVILEEEPPPTRLFTKKALAATWGRIGLWCIATLEYCIHFQIPPMYQTASPTSMFGLNTLAFLFACLAAVIGPFWLMAKDGLHGGNLCRTTTAFFVEGACLVSIAAALLWGHFLLPALIVFPLSGVAYVRFLHRFAHLEANRAAAVLQNRNAFFRQAYPDKFGPTRSLSPSETASGADELKETPAISETSAGKVIIPPW